MSSTYLTVRRPNEPCATWPPAEPLAREYKYELDNFQKHAICAIHRNENVLVTAKTGSGKTLVGEYQIAHSLARGKRVFYTTPIKSLSNQKFHDLKAIFPSVGIMTGDIKFKPHADVVILTTEILRNLLYKRGTTTESIGLSGNMTLDGLDAVIFDEVHYINNPERGKVWEETMILLPPEVKLILLSATIDRPELFASWLGDLRQRPIVLVPTTHRVVPLTHCVLSAANPPELITIMDEREVFIDKAYKDWLAVRKDRADAVKAHKQQVRRRDFADEGDVAVARGVMERSRSFTATLNDTVRFLRDREALPALFFCFSRRGCEEHAFRVEENLITASEAADVRAIMRFHLRDHLANLERLPQYHAICDLTAKGIAFHHSGLLPVLKEVVEILFSRGLCRALFCTETFAVGINMPTKTAVFLGLKKYDDGLGAPRIITTDEYIQMAGRAGRRGLDKFGLVVYLPEDDPISCAEMKTMMKSGMPSITSRMDFGYDFILKTMHSSAAAAEATAEASAATPRWLTIMKDSYWYQQAAAKRTALLADIDALRVKQAALSIPAADLQEFKDREGLEAANRLGRSKETQRALDQWKMRHVGPKWIAAEKLYRQYKDYAEEIAELQKCVERADKIMCGGGLVEASIQYLREIGYLGGGGGGNGLTQRGTIVIGSPKGDTLATGLTQRGVLATEFNEAHPLLATELYMSGLLNQLTADELCVVLAAFLEADRNAGAGFRVPYDLSDGATVALRKLGMVARELRELEDGVRGPVAADPKYWELSSRWPTMIADYLGHLDDGVDVSSAITLICQKYEIYEGNFVRAILKLSNMLEELQGVATYMKNIELLRTMEGLTQRLVSGVIVPDSLYLRLE